MYLGQEKLTCQLDADVPRHSRVFEFIRNWTELSGDVRRQSIRNSADKNGFESSTSTGNQRRFSFELKYSWDETDTSQNQSCLDELKQLIDFELVNKLKSAVLQKSLCSPLALDNKSLSVVNSTAIFTSNGQIAVQINFDLSAKLSSEVAANCLNEISRSPEVFANLDFLRLIPTNNCGSLAMQPPIYVTTTPISRLSNFRRRRQLEEPSTFEPACQPPYVRQITSDVYLGIGTDFQLFCGIDPECDGYYVAWQKENSELDPSRTSYISALGNKHYAMQLRNAQCNDSGVYRCLVRGPEGTEVLESRHLKVVINDSFPALEPLLATVNHKTSHQKKQRSKTSSFTEPLKVTLYDSGRDGLDNWVFYKLGSGRGWQLTSTEGKLSFRVCDVGSNDSNSQQIDSWIRSPYLKVNSTVIQVDLEFSITPCSRHQPNCTQSFEILVLETENETPSEHTNAWEIQNFKLIERITGGQMINPNRTAVRFAHNFDGFYLALKSTDVCVTVFSLKISYSACEEIHSGLTYFPITPTGVGHTSVAVGKCAIGAVPLPAASKLYCSANGTWLGQPLDLCVCQPGYMRLRNVCLPKGPKCHWGRGDTITQANQKSSVVECQPGEICFSEISNGKVIRGCLLASDCHTDISDYQGCIRGTTLWCRYCCHSDGCNFLPFRSNGTSWSDLQPNCVDIEPPSFFNCNRSDVVVGTRWNDEPEEVEFSIPTATDNSGLVTLTSTPANLYSPFPLVFPPSQRQMNITFTAVDLMGLRAICTFRVIMRGWAFSL